MYPRHEQSECNRGAFGFEMPSIKTTTTSIVDDRIPRMDVYDRSDRGKKIVGINLKQNIKSKQDEGEQRRHTRQHRLLCRHLRGIVERLRGENLHRLLREERYRAR